MERPKKRVKLTIGDVDYFLDPAVVSAITTIVKAVDPSNDTSAPIERASLLGIPSELRLEIFNYLLPSDLPFTIHPDQRLDELLKEDWIDDKICSPWSPKVVWSACKNFRSLMLTCQLVSREASELFHKNIIIQFSVNHGNFDNGYVCHAGLCGFGAAWSPGNENAKPAPHIEAAMQVSLGAFLRNVRSLYLTLVCASMKHDSIWSIPTLRSYASNSDSGRGSPPRSRSPTGDGKFDDDISVLMNALKTARCLEKIWFSIEVDIGEMKNLTVQEACRGIKHLLQPFINLTQISWEVQLLDPSMDQYYTGGELDTFLDGLEGADKLNFLHLDSPEEEIAAAEEELKNGGKPKYLSFHFSRYSRFD